MARRSSECDRPASWSGPRFASKSAPARHALRRRPQQVERLKAFLASGDPHPEFIDEVGIPTARTMDNDRFWWSDGTHHLQRVHIALGNNVERKNAFTAPATWTAR